MWKSLLDYLPRGGMLSEADWQRRHRLLEWVLLAHIPGLAVLGLLLGHTVTTVGLVLIAPIAALVAGHILPGRRGPAVAVTAGLVYCSTALVGLTDGTIEAHFHFFVIIGFIALYQDWAPFLCNIVLTVVTHGLGSAFQESLIFVHVGGQQNPWLWASLHGLAVLAACVGVTLFWRVTEDSQNERNVLVGQLAEAEVGRQQFTADLLLNLARRNQTMLYRQLDIINQLEESEQDPDVLADLFRLDHLATRVRRNAENLLVLSGEQPPRVWREPVALRDVVRAAIAETEDLDRVGFTVDEVTAVTGRCVTDLTHLLAELTENAVRYSPPDAVVTIRSRPTSRWPEGYLLTIEDWGVGMPEEDLAAANALLADPPDVDLSVSRRLGFHVVARLAARHGIGVTLDATPGAGTTAIVHLPAALLEQAREPARHAAPEKVGSREIGPARGRPWAPTTAVLEPVAAAAVDVSATSTALLVPALDGPAWSGWWEATDGAGEEHLAPPTVPAQRTAEPSNGTEVRDRVPSLLVPAAPDPVADRVATMPGVLSASAAAAPAVSAPDAPAVVEQAVRSAPRSAAPSGVAARSADVAPAPPIRAADVAQPAAPSISDPTVVAATVQGLRRRVPQTSLAPELRRMTEVPPAVLPVAQGAAAASALSRYQAGRRHAQTAVAEPELP